MEKRRIRESLIGLGIAFLVLPVLATAQDQSSTVDNSTIEANNNTNSVVPEGMEAVSVGGVNMVIPKGTRLELNGSQLMVEDTAHYMSRKFEDMDRRLKAIEQKLEVQDKEIEDLKAALSR